MLRGFQVTFPKFLSFFFWMITYLKQFQILPVKFFWRNEGLFKMIPFPLISHSFSNLASTADTEYTHQYLCYPLPPGSLIIHFSSFLCSEIWVKLMCTSLSRTGPTSHSFPMDQFEWKGLRGGSHNMEGAWVLEKLYGADLTPSSTWTELCIGKNIQ